jgi:hypothetical protein
MSIGLYSLNKSAVKKSASVDTHTHKRGEGKGGKGTRTASHNKQRGNEGQHNKGREQAEGAHNKQAEQRKEGGEGGGEKAHKNPTLARKRAGTTKHNRQQSKTAAAETTEAGQPPGGTNTHLSHGQEGRKGWGGLEEGEGRGERQKDRKEEGGVPSYACRVHGPTGEKKRGASSYNHVSRITPEVRGGGLKLSAGLDEVSNCGCKQPSQWSHMDLLNDVCTSSPGSMNLLFSG